MLVEKHPLKPQSLLSLKLKRYWSGNYSLYKMLNPQEILKKNSFRVTQHRCEVLTYFIQSKIALNHRQLELKYRGTINRVSLYRILHSFTEKKILCKLIDSVGSVSYVLDKHSSQNDSHVHPHYKCKTCHDVVELPELPADYRRELEKLNVLQLNMLAEGICQECQKSMK